MEIIKRQVVNAYILLEGIISLGIMVVIVSLMLTGIRSNQEFIAEARHHEEVMGVALMAVQTKRDNMNVNGCQVRIVRTERKIHIFENNQSVFSLEKK